MSAKARGLGRGLDALLPKVGKDVQQVPLAQLRASPFQPRLSMDEGAIAELSASIAAKGVLQPILVRPAENGYEIVAGERRFRAARQAGLVTIPAVVRELSDQETLEIAIIENLQREDLNPMEEARAYKQLLEFGLTQEKVSESVSKSRSAIANTLRLLTLPDDAQDALEANNITAGHARAILSQPATDRSWALAEILRRDLTVRQAENLKRRQPKDDEAGGEQPASVYHQLEQDLSRFAGTRVNINGEKKGRIELYFHDEDELQRLLELLGYQA